MHLSNSTNARRTFETANVQRGISNADPHQLIAMLMQGVLDRLSRARGAMTQGEIAARGELVSQSITIIGGLKGCLDVEAGDELSSNLSDLYDYMCYRLVQSNADSDPAMLDEVAALLTEIKTGWDGIPESVRRRFSTHRQSDAEPQESVTESAC